MINKAFLIEWVDGIPSHVNAVLVEACLFQPDTFMDRKTVKVKPVVYPEEMSDFNKMAHGEYIHQDVVAELVKDILTEMDCDPGKGAEEIANHNMRKVGIRHKRLDWQLTLVKE